jgi:transposase
MTPFGKMLMSIFNESNGVGMRGFITVDRQTDYLLPPSVEDWLPENHLARFIVEVIDRLDLTELTRSYGGRGSAAHHPAVLLGLLIYGYVSGIPSSRKIERATYDSIAFRYIAANTQPDHDTLAHFRRRFGAQFEQLFVQVLMLAREMGMLKLGKVSRRWQQDQGQCEQAQRAVAGTSATNREAVATGSAAADGAGRIGRSQERTGWHGSAQRDRTAQAAPCRTRRGQTQAGGTRQERDLAAQAEYEGKLAKRQAKRDTGKKPGGKDPEPPASGPQDKDQINLTDEESRIMKVASGGFDQCYNGQLAVDADSMLIVGAFVTQAGNDSRQIAPMLALLAKHEEQVGLPSQLLTDTGYFSAANVNACVASGIEPLIAMKREMHHLPVLERFTEPAPHADDADAVAQMAHRLKTKKGRADYAMRKQTVEPVFGIIKHVMKFGQFMVRGLKQVGHEWNLVALAWNLKRMMNMKMA